MGPMKASSSQHFMICFTMSNGCFLNSDFVSADTERKKYKEVIGKRQLKNSRQFSAWI